jgi:hypothetical protein
VEVRVVRLHLVLQQGLAFLQQGLGSAGFVLHLEVHGLSQLLGLLEVDDPVASLERLLDEVQGLL